MRQLSIHGVGDLRLDPAVAPAPGPADAVVRVHACGICGSDLSYVKWGGVNRPEGGTMPIGHEAAGELVAVGADVKGLAVGQRVVINPMRTAGFIGSGGPEGAFTEQLLVRGAKPGETLHVLPDDLPWEVAALTEPLAVALHAVNRAEVGRGSKAVVYGCGPIGLAVVLWLVDRGVTDVVAVDLSDERLARAAALGARACVNGARGDVAARLAELHGAGRLYGRAVVGSDVFIDAAGGPTVLADVLRMGKFQSRLVIAAAYGRAMPLDMNHLLTSEMTVTSALAYPTEMADVVAALPRIRDTAASLISHRFAFGDVLDGFAVAGTPASAKVMIRFDAA